MARKLKDDKWSALYDFTFYYASYLWLPALVLLISYWRSGDLRTFAFVILTGLLAVCFYSRFIEPRWLRVNRQNIDLTPEDYQGRTATVRIALFSDTHYGIYRNVMPLYRLRRRIEKEEARFVLVAGDLTNHLVPAELHRALGDFANFKQPVFAVLGNHDYGLPGWIMPAEIAKTISGHGVTVLENGSTRIEVDGIEFRITGLRDHYAGTADYGLLAPPGDDDQIPHLVMAHNADAAHEYPHGSAADLTVSGHTHGGQIRLPLIYHKMIPTRHGFDQGLYHANGYKVYVSSGTGMDVLPVRLFIPPSLDILSLTVAAPAAANDGEKADETRQGSGPEEGRAAP